MLLAAGFDPFLIFPIIIISIISSWQVMRNYLANRLATKEVADMLVQWVFDIIAIATLILLAIHWREEWVTHRLWQSLESDVATERFDPAMVAHLPVPAQRYLCHAIAPGTPLASSVELAMHGSFCPNPAASWWPMRGQEILAASKGFVWKATIGRGLFRLSGADRYANGQGKVGFCLWGLVPFVHQSNADTARSSIGRLVAELVWLPSALLPQRGARWDAVDDSTARVSLTVDGEPLSLNLTVDGTGKLQKLWLLRWGEDDQQHGWHPIPFGGEVEGERQFGGFAIPTKLRAGWWFGTDRYCEFFRSTIDRAEFC